MNAKLSLLPVLLGVLVFGVAAKCQAQVSDSSGTATINVQPGLSITRLTDPSWGTVVRPSSGTTRYQLGYNTGAVTVVSGTGHSFNDGLFGSYLVNGALSAPISYSVSIGSFSGSGVSAVIGHINGTSSSGTGTLSALGTYTLQIGGQVDVTSAATSGSHTATVTVTVDYQ